MIYISLPTKIGLFVIWMLSAIVAANAAFPSMYTLLCMDFVRDCIVMLLSVALGIPAGLWLNRRVQAKADNEKRHLLAVAMQQTCRENKRLLRLLTQHNSKANPPTFLMDTSALTATVNDRTLLLNDEALFNNLNHIHYELNHINERVRMTLGTISATGGRLVIDLRKYGPWPADDLTRNEPEVLLSWMASTNEIARNSRKTILCIRKQLRKYVPKTSDT